MPLPPKSAALEVFLLGLIEFDEIQHLQRRLVYDLGERDLGGVLVLCEHPPTISVGRLGSRAHIRPDDDTLRRAGIPVHWVNRGGGCVLHLPGQLVAYVLLPIRDFPNGLGGYLDGLRQVFLGVLEEFDLAGAARADEAGVFLSESRVATIGVAVNRWITTHGATLNVGPYLRAFDLLDEPGPRGAPLRQTSMESRRQRPAPMSRVREAFLDHFEKVFGLHRRHIYTDHPWIHRKVVSHAHAVSLG